MAQTITSLSALIVIFILVLFVPLVIVAFNKKYQPETGKPITQPVQTQNGLIPIPQTFLSFFTDVMTLLIQRCHLHEGTWRKIKTDKKERRKVVKLLDETVDTYYPEIDMNKGDDFMPESAYENPPWYRNSLGFRSLLSRLVELTQVYMYRESKYYQSQDLHSKMDAIMVHIMTKFPEDKVPDDPKPWGGLLWLTFSMYMPRSMLMWILARNSYVSVNPSSRLSNGKKIYPLDTLRFIKNSDTIDAVDRIAGSLMDKLYSYPPDPDSCATTQCHIISMGTARADSSLLSLPWLICRILKTLFDTPFQMDELLTSFKLTNQAIQNTEIPEDSIVHLLKSYFKSNVARKLYTPDELGERRYLHILFRDGTVLYRHMRFDFQISLDVQLYNRLVGKLLLPENNWIATDNLLRKCAFSKMETPFLEIHPQRYYINPYSRASTNSIYGEYGAFCMNISAFASMKQRSWSFCYRAQKLPFPILVHTEDGTYEIGDLILYSKEMLDKYSGEYNEFVQYVYKPGVLRSTATKDRIFAAITSSSDTPIYPTRAEALTVHLNDSLEHAAAGLITTFQLDYDEVKFLPVDAPSKQQNRELPAQAVKYVAQEFILITQYGAHICVLVNYNEKTDTQQDEEQVWVGLGHTYNTSKESHQIETVKANQTYHVGSWIVHLVTGFSEIEINEFTDKSGVQQYGLRGLASTKDIIAYSILHSNLPNAETSTSSDSTNGPPTTNELTKQPTMTRADALSKIEANLDTTDWTLSAKNGKLYLFDKRSNTLKIGLPVPIDFPETTLLNRAELRNMIGDETKLTYRVRSRSDALLPSNYTEQQNSDAAKTDVAPLDNPKADANDQTVNYKIAIRLDEAYPDLRMDQLSNKQKLLEYERSAYEVRVDEVPMFPNAQK